MLILSKRTHTVLLSRQQIASSPTTILFIRPLQSAASPEHVPLPSSSQIATRLLAPKIRIRDIESNSREGRAEDSVDVSGAVGRDWESSGGSFDRAT